MRRLILCKGDLAAEICGCEAESLEQLYKILFTLSAFCKQCEKSFGEITRNGESVVPTSTTFE